MKNIILLCIFLSGAAALFAQKFQLTGDQINGVRNVALTKSFTNYSVFKMDANMFLQFAEKDHEAFTLHLQLEGEQSFDMALSKRQLLAEDYVTIETTARGEKRNYAKPEVYTYQGNVFGSGTNHAAITVAENLIYGSFEQDGRVFYLEPLWYLDPGQPKDLYVFYDSGDVVEGPEMTCAPVEIKQREEEVFTEEQTPRCTPLSVRFAIASDYSMYSFYGSTNDVVAHNIAVMNLVQTNYDNEFDESISFNIVTNWVSTSILTDPANSPVYTTFLIQFRDWANAGGLGSTTYALAHLRTRHTFGNTAGASFLNGMCSSNNYGFLSEYTDIACRLQKHTAHEIGHSLHALHSPSGIMQPGGFCSFTWHPTSISEINNGISQSYSCMQSLLCDPPASIPLPASFNYLCGYEEQCYTFSLPCIGSFTVTNYDPDLVVIPFGQSICIQNYSSSQRTAVVTVNGYDYCGNLAVTTNWLIHINYENCAGLQGGAGDRSQLQQQTAAGFQVLQSNDYLIVQDQALNPRSKTVTIYDLSGRLVSQQFGDSPQISVPIHELPQSILIVRVQAEGETLVTKVSHF